MEPLNWTTKIRVQYSSIKISLRLSRFSGRFYNFLCGFKDFLGSITMHMMISRP
jgi:hypothetical protein